VDLDVQPDAVKRKMLIKPSELKKTNYCLSCGATENIHHRRYCSVKCRQNLRQKLNMKNGLLQALNTRYAAFYFSDTIIVLDIVPYGCKDIFRYTAKREQGSPAADFNLMTNDLGKAWWEVSLRTNRNYLASQHVLKLAKRCAISDGLQRPRMLKIPSVKMESLNYLSINKIDLGAPDLSKIIKSAYRRQVKIYHPDLGGKASDFRKIHDAYKELLRWADHPMYVHRRGFPDKWYYSGENKKWVQPISARR